MQQIPAFSPLIIVLNSTTQASVITFQVLKIVLLSVIIRTAVRKHWHRLRDFWLPPLRRWIIRSSGMLHSVCSVFRCQAVFCGSSRGLFDLWRLYWKAVRNVVKTTNIRYVVTQKSEGPTDAIFWSTEWSKRSGDGGSKRNELKE